MNRAGVAIAVITLAASGVILVNAYNYLFGPPRLQVVVQNQSKDFLREGAVTLGGLRRHVPAIPPGETWTKEYPYGKGSLAVTFKRKGKTDIECRMGPLFISEPPCGNIMRYVTVEGDSVRWWY